MAMTLAANKELSAVPVGARAEVVSIHANGMMRRRLLDLGLVPGTVVEAVRRSPAGDPTAFSIRGATIALRSTEGRKVLVRQVVG